MKKIWKTTITLLSVIGFCFAFSAIPAMAAERTLVVNGKGIVSVLPDTAIITMGVETTAKTAQEAQQENANKMAIVQKELEAMGITKEQIKTSRFQVYPQYDYSGKSEEKILLGYTATNMIRVTTKDIDGVSSILDRATAAGVNVNDGIIFSVEDSNSYYKKALGLALENANSSAASLATAMAVNIGTPVKVEEVSSEGSYTKRMSSVMEGANMASDTAGGASTSISYDTIDIIARIIVTYEY